MNSEVTVYDADVFALTDEGNEELQGGLTRLPTVALELLVALDGKLSFAEAAGRDVDAVDKLIEIKISYDTDPEVALNNCRFWAPLYSMPAAMRKREAERACSR